MPKAPAAEGYDLNIKAKDASLLVEVAKILCESMIRIKVVNILKSLIATKLFWGDELRIEVKNNLNLPEIAMEVAYLLRKTHEKKAKELW